MANISSETRFQLNTGAQMPAIGLGTWQSAPGEVTEAVYAALKTGYRHLDAALCYQNEKEVGAGLRRAFDEGITKREDVFVTTKLWNSYHDNPAEGLDKSLADLGLEYVDLYLMHWPVAFKAQADRSNLFPSKSDGLPDIDLNRHFNQTWEDLQNLPTSKAKAVGVSNFSVHNLEILLKYCSEKNLKVPAANQIELHPYLPQDDVLQYCKEKGIVITAYSPLGSAGAPFLKKPEIIDVAAKKGVSPANILLSWHVARGTTVVPKSVNPDRIRENYNIVPLDQKDLDDISNLSQKAIAAEGLKRTCAPKLGVDLHFPDVKFE